MRNITFYDQVTLRGAPGVVRRVLRKLLLPFFRRQVEILNSICDRLDAAEATIGDVSGRLDVLGERHEQAAERMQAAMAFGWDYVAMARRIAALEDRVELLTSRLESERGASAAA